MPNDQLRTLIIDRQTNIISTGYIKHTDLYNFRMSAFLDDTKRTYPGARILSADGYDLNALHVLYINGGEIAGSARIIRSVNRQLPISSLFDNVGIGDYDLELSRFVARFDRTGKKAFLYLLPVVSLILRCLPLVGFNSKIYADVLTGYPRTINRATYIEFGFVSENKTAFDRHYNLDSELFVLPTSNIDLFNIRAEFFSKSVGKFVEPNFSIRQFIKDSLGFLEIDKLEKFGYEIAATNRAG